MQSQTMSEVSSIIKEMADKRFKSIIGVKELKTNYDELLTPLIYQSVDNNKYYGLQLPQCFPSMTEPDVLSVLQWYVHEGSVVHPEHDLVEVHANFGDIVIPVLMQRGTYRVAQMLKAEGEQMKMGDVFIVLQLIKSQTHPNGTAKRRAA